MFVINFSSFIFFVYWIFCLVLGTSFFLRFLSLRLYFWSGWIVALSRWFASILLPPRLYWLANVYGCVENCLNCGEWPIDYVLFWIIPYFGLIRSPWKYNFYTFQQKKTLRRHDFALLSMSWLCKTTRIQAQLNLDKKFPILDYDRYSFIILFIFNSNSHKQKILWAHLRGCMEHLTALP